MTEYAFDLYPRDDPRDGSRLQRFTYEDLIRAHYRDVIGVGSGEAEIWIDHAGAEDIDVRGEQYIRVVRLGGVEAVIGGMWTSKMPFETAVRAETRRLTLSGPGQMAYLARAVLAPHSYLDNTTVGVAGMDPFDDTIRFYLQGPLAGGDFLGAVLWRAVADFAGGFRSGATYTHEHSTDDEFGVEFTDSHDDDRTVSRIPDLVLGFDQNEDSNGNAWTLPSGQFTAQVGDNLLAVVQRLMQAGLSLWMDPHTFTLYAWERRPATKLGRSTDRTGGAWGADVVRFQYPTDNTPATGNILSDATRIVNAYLPRGPLWVGGQDVYVKETGTADAMYEGFVPWNSEDVSALEEVAATQRTSREEASDVGQLRTKLGDDEDDGYYLPGEHYRVDELVTIHTGTGEFDYDEASYPIGAWRISLPERSAEWEAWPELGSSYTEAEQREFAVPPSSGTPTLLLCEAMLPGTGGQNNIAGDATWTAHFSGTGSPGPQSVADGDTGTFAFTHLIHASYFMADFGSAVTVAGFRLVQAPNVSGNMAGGVTVDWSDDAVAWTTLHTEGSLGTDTGAIDFGASASHRYWRVNTTSATPNNVNGWLVYEIELYDSAPGSGTTNPLNGSSNRARRCDSSEHEISDRLPGVDDDAGAGYPRRTIWHVIGGATYISLDGSDGAAVWELLSQPSEDDDDSASDGGGFDVTPPQSVPLPAWVNPSGSGAITADPQGRLDLDTGANYKSFPGIAFLEGRLHLVYREGTEHNSEGGTIEYRTSDDLGRTWTAATTIATPPGGAHDYRDPCILATSAGRLVVGFDDSNGAGGNGSTLGLYTMYSDNRGQDWSTPVLVEGTDDDHGATTCPAVELPDGTILLPGFVDPDGDGNYFSVFWTSTDGGTTFGGAYTTIAAAGANDFNEVRLVYAASGILHAFLRSESNGHTYRAESTDFGETWGAPVDEISSSAGRPDVVEIWPNVFLWFGRGTSDASHWSVSWDEGSTWTALQETDSGVTANGQYHAPLVLAPGYVIVVYSIENSSTDADLYVRYYRDGYGIDPLGNASFDELTVGGGEVLTADNLADAGHYELLMTGSGPPEPLEDGTGTDWLYVWVPD